MSKCMAVMTKESGEVAGGGGLSKKNNPRLTVRAFLQLITYRQPGSSLLRWLTCI